MVSWEEGKLANDNMIHTVGSIGLLLVLITIIVSGVSFYFEVCGRRVEGVDDGKVWEWKEEGQEGEG